MVMMKLCAYALGAVLVAASATGGVRGQDTAPKKPGGAIGDLVAVDTAHGKLTIKTTSGTQAQATVTASTEYLLVEPGKTDLKGAVAVTLADVKVGDRVWARGDPGADGAIAARQIVVMSAEAIGERNRRDAQDWQRRGVMGEVRSVDPATGEVAIESYRGDAITVAIGQGTTLRRLKPGTTDLSSAEPIALGDIHAGDQVAARGERTPDGARITAETVLAGTFPRPVRGRVAAVDAAKGEVRIAVREGQEMTLTLGDGALVRKLTPPAARPPGAAGPGAGPASGPGAGPGAGGERRGPRGFAFALGDRSELEHRTTPITLGDVKAGDFVFAVVEPGATGAAARAKVIVKIEVPADRTPRGPNIQGPPPDDPTSGDFPF